jgi:transposase-like protein
MKDKASDDKPPKAMSLEEFQAWIPDEASAVVYFEKTRWNGEPTCPHCESKDVLRVVSGKPMPFRCRSCREHFSVKTGTVMQSSKIGVRIWLLTMYFMSVAKKGVSSCQMARQFGIKQDTAWFLGQRIRESWNQERFIVDGEVEMDETYIGGKEKNKHASKRRHAGRGGVGKTMVVGLRQRKGRIFAVVAEPASKEVLHEIIDQRIAPTATLYTDEHRGYVGANVKTHMAVKHSAGEYVRGAGKHKRRGIVLGFTQARILRNIPQHVRQTPAQICGRICHAPECAWANDSGTNTLHPGRCSRQNDALQEAH